MRLRPVEQSVPSRQRRTNPLVAHVLKVAVDGEAVSLLGTRVHLLVGILVCHALTRNGLYDLVAPHVQRDAPVILRSLVRAKGYRSPLTRGIRVKVEGVR